MQAAKSAKMAADAHEEELAMEAKKEEELKMKEAAAKKDKQEKQEKAAAAAGRFSLLSSKIVDHATHCSLCLHHYLRPHPPTLHTPPSPLRNRISMLITFLPTHPPIHPSIQPRAKRRRLRASRRRLDRRLLPPQARPPRRARCRPLVNARPGRSAARRRPPTSTRASRSGQFSRWSR